MCSANVLALFTDYTFLFRFVCYLGSLFELFYWRRNSLVSVCKYTFDIVLCLDSTGKSHATHVSL